jgi:hypothetical protein
MKTLPSSGRTRTRIMTQEKTTVETLHEEFMKFKTTMWEVRLLKQVTMDLRNYRRMMRHKKYD